MDRNKFSAIAHRDHAFSNPINEQKINAIMNLIKMTPTDNVIDIGAGTSELLIRLIEKYNISATAVEQFDGSIQTAKQRAEGRISLHRITFVCDDAKQVIHDYSTAEFSLGICIGSTHAIGEFSESARRQCHWWSV